MQTNEDIVARFIKAIDTLYINGDISTIRSFERECKMAHNALFRLRKDNSRHLMRPAWLAHLVEHYEVSADWLLLGRGRMFE